MTQWSIAVHVGVGGFPVNHEQELKDLMTSAVTKGTLVLRKISSRMSIRQVESELISAAEVVVSEIELSGLTNSGCGSHLNRQGYQQTDATIITSSPTVGCVASTEETNTINRAASIAKNRLANTTNASIPVFMTGHSAAPSSKKESTHSKVLMDSTDTVGAVIFFNHEGEQLFVSASSSGGFKNKPVGRVGAAGCPGAAAWASKFCSVSLSGAGEVIITELLAAKLGWFPNTSRQIINDFASNHQVPIGGVILLPRSVMFFYNTQSLGVAFASNHSSCLDPKAILFNRKGLSHNEWCSKPEISSFNLFDSDPNVDHSDFDHPDEGPTIKRKKKEPQQETL